MKTALLSIILLWAMVTVSYAQSSLLQQRATLRYSNEKLGTVLRDISESYGVRFAYSSHFIPVDEKVSLQVSNTPLSDALHMLFTPIGIVYAQIGGQIVLKMSNQPQKSEPMTQLNTLPKSVKQSSPVHPLSERERWLLEQMKRDREATLATLDRPQPQQIRGGLSQALSIEKYQLEPIQYEEEDRQRMAQVSILPFVGTNLLRSAEMTNKVSVNLLWGVNGGVEGLEVGGLMNHIVNDVNGVQIAGLGNIVGGNTVGTQVGGIFNLNRGSVQGVQASGLFNVSGETNAVQIGGLFNIATANFAGVQAAGLFNIAHGKADGVQTASLFNIAEGATQSQIAGLFNVAQDVEVLQLSPLFNAGKNVKGLQIALINIADTTSGVPIGVLNFIKKGYNKVEIAAGDALYANIGLKVGARSFYNIFHFGVRWDEVDAPTNSNEPTATSTISSWGLGYGLGTTVRLGRQALFNLEAVAIHINELEEWTQPLNLLNQFRVLFDVNVGRHLNLFAGPTGNVMVSKLKRTNYETQGSMIAPYTFYNKTGKSGTNVQMWVGFNAGLRF